MTDLDDLKASFSQKLERRVEQHEARFERELASLRASLLSEADPNLPADLAQRLAGYDEKLAASGQVPPASRAPHATFIDLNRTSPLEEIDRYFSQTFDLGRYYPKNWLRYPTVYCETLEEFFTPMLADMNYSPQARQGELARMIAEAEHSAAQSGSGILGINLPGQGCYINGWLIGRRWGIPPRQALEDPTARREILSTVIHEKLGHGFLEVYSVLGKVKSNLGITLVETARRFGLRPADDPVESQRRDQAKVLGMVSQLVEEGWATWVEMYLQTGGTPRHSLAAITKAMENLPARLPQREETRDALLFALAALFGEEEAPPLALLQAVQRIEVLGSGLDEYFGAVLRQPLRYAVGELLFRQAAANLGPRCVPYVALIAANVDFDPGKISLTDLATLLGADPRLHPDARLAALSRLKITQPNSVTELAQRAEAQLSFAVPKELKQSGDSTPHLWRFQ